MRTVLLAFALAFPLGISGPVPTLHAEDSANPTMPPLAHRFAKAGGEEIPDFQRHVLPLMGQLGCNSRSCHGSFQGQGGFQLSLFGYDFESDHNALMAKDEHRVDVENPDASLILAKPTLMEPHEGGQILKPDSWQYETILRWIEAGAPVASRSAEFARLDVIPSEIVFEREGQEVPLRVVAHWSDGTSEDVTCITRFRTNDESVAEVDASGLVTSTGKGDTYVIAMYDNGVAATQVLRPVSEQVGPAYPRVDTPTEIDRLIVEKLQKLGVVPSQLCPDDEFLRRASLDLTGTLPTPEEVQAFLADSTPDKRARKIDELLERPTYAAYWANRFCDIMGNNSALLQNNGLNAQMSRQWYDWIERRIAENVSYDDLIAGIVLGRTREPGQKYDDFIADYASYFRKDDPADFSDRESMPYFWARTNLRQPEEKALAFSYTFLGVRLECAQCHKHPFDQWTQQDFNQFKNFFELIRYGNSPEGGRMLRQVRSDLEEKFQKQAEESGKKLVFNNNVVRRELAKRIQGGEPIPFEEVLIAQPRSPRRDRKPANSKVDGSRRVFSPKVLGGDEVDLGAYEDPREPLMAWMRSPDNPYFAQAFVNRVWANDFGTGIINPPDDMNLASPPSNRALLDYLTREFIAHDYDMKWLHRTIMASNAYQRSWRPNDSNRLDERNFSRAVVRRLPAETLLDAIEQATASTQRLTTFPNDLEKRAIGPLAATRYGRTGPNDYAARVFGRATRDTNCDCARSEEPNLLQLIYLQNDNDILTKLDRNDGWVAEFDRQNRKGSEASHTSSLQDRVEELERLVARSRRQAERNERAKQILQKYELELAEARDRLKATEPTDGAPERARIKPEAVDAAIREAYFRTLNRPPTESERAAARAYFEESETPAEGLKGVLWALLNTREFITNH